MIELENHHFFRFGLDRFGNPMVFLLGFWALTAVSRLLSLITFLGFVVSDLIALMLAVLLIKDYARFGFTKSKKWVWYLAAGFSGPALVSFGFFVFYQMYGYNEANWFYASAVGLSRIFTYISQMGFETSKIAGFLISSALVITFAPFGEEFFYRGFLQSTVARRFGPYSGMSVSILLFAFVHLADGIAGLGAYRYELTVIFGYPAYMVFAGWLFAWLRHRSGSVWVSLICHSAHNLMMNILIFLILFI